MGNGLPNEMAEGAMLQGNEYGWRIDAFPSAVQRAPAVGYACLGGQFQFRLESTYEMYWIDTDSDERQLHENWPAFCERSCKQVLQKFEGRLASTNFEKEAAEWPRLLERLKDKLQLDEALVFVAYFVDESE